MHIVLSRFKEVFRGTKEECQKYVLDNHVGHGYKNDNVISVTNANGDKTQTVFDYPDRCVTWRLMLYDFFWKKNDTNIPNRETYPDWVTWTWFKNPHVGRTVWRMYR